VGPSDELDGMDMRKEILSTFETLFFSLSFLRRIKILSQITDHSFQKETVASKCDSHFT
jgi:hypothetical protein